MTVPSGMVAFLMTTTMPLRMTKPSSSRLPFLHAILVDHPDIAADARVFIDDRSLDHRVCANTQTELFHSPASCSRSCGDS